MKFVKSLEHRHSQVLRALGAVLTSGNYSEGPFTKSVEATLKEMLSAQVVSMNSCGSALYTAFKYLKSRGAQTVLCQNNTFYATGAMACEAGLHVSLVDSKSPSSPSMGIDSLRKAYGQVEADAVVLTHVGGWLAEDYDDIAQFCSEKDVVLVEDCAHVMGVPGAGQYGDVSCWSFYPTKAVPCGEGGALSTNDPHMYQFAREFSSYGKYKVDGVIYYSRGMNLRMSEWDAAVLSVQLEHLQDIMELRTRDADKLKVIAPCLLAGPSNYYKFPVHKAYAKGLKTLGPVYQLSDQLHMSMNAYGPSVTVDLSNSLQWAEDHVCLPIGEGLYHGMTVEDVHNFLKV